MGLLNPDIFENEEEEMMEDRAFPKPETEISVLGDEISFDDKDATSFGTKIKALYESAKSIDEIGDHESGYVLPKLAERLLKQSRLIKLWSNICRDHFNYGKIPATSSSVECEFKNVKGILLKDKRTPMRPDAFIDCYVNDCLKGRTNIFIAQSIENDEFPASNAIKNSKIAISLKAKNKSENVADENYSQIDISNNSSSKFDDEYLDYSDNLIENDKIVIVEQGKIVLN